MGLFDFLKKQKETAAEQPKIQMNEPRDRYGRTPLMNAALAGDLGAAILQLSLGVNVNGRDAEKR